MSTKSLVRVAFMAALIAVCAQVTIPLGFTPVPFTLQVPAVLLAGMLLGPGLGTVAALVYLLVGAAGLPVFAGLRGGFGVFVGPTGGYLMAYPLAALAAGLGARGRTGFIPLFISGLAGLVLIYAGGAGWLVLWVGRSLSAAIAAGVTPFFALDVVKVVLATWLTRRLRAANVLPY